MKVSAGTGVLAVLLALASVIVASGPVSGADRVIWDGGVETGGLPAGNITGGGTTSSQYLSILQDGGPGLTEIVTDRRRTPDSTRSLKVTMPAGSQREQPVSTHSWFPDAVGSVDEWYGVSMYYDQDWDLNQISGTYWHNPLVWRMDGDNGSLNFSGDLVGTTPHMMLRRNTVKDKEGFYTDGLGLDKIDAGPIVKGQWMDFVVHIRWSTTSTNALREVWRDGVYMGGKTSVNAVGTSRHRLRIGQYQTTAINHVRTTYFDNVRIGSSYAAVDPARNRDDTTTTPPVVTTVVPGAGSTGTDVAKDVIVTFSKPMNRTTAQSAFSLRKAATTTNVSGTFSWNSESTVMTFNPGANLAAATTYNVALSTAAQDVAGNAMAAAFRARFRTG